MYLFKTKQSVRALPAGVIFGSSVLYFNDSRVSGFIVENLSFESTFGWNCVPTMGDKSVETL